MATKHRKMNVPLLRKVQESLLRQSLNPEKCRFNMNHYGDADNNPDAPVCHTKCCIAGETLIQAGAARIQTKGGLKIIPKYLKTVSDLRDGGGVDDYFARIATNLLGLTRNQANRLFVPPGTDFEGARWHPQDIADYDQANRADSRTQKALIGARRIERFILTKGKE